MKPKDFDLRSWVERLVSQVIPGTKVNEIPLFDTGTKIYVFQVDRRIFFGINDVINILEIVGYNRNPTHTYEYLRSAGHVEKLGEFEDLFGNGGLEVVCSNALTNELLQSMMENDDRKMNASFNNMEPSQPSKFILEDYNLAGNHTEDMTELYPFNGTWTDNIMDGILKSIYTSDGQGIGLSKPRVDSRAGRGRQVRASGGLKDRPFVCSFNDCKRAFKRYEHLKRHTLMHTGERPHKCKFPGCSKSFSRSDNLSQHYKIHSVPGNLHTKSYESYRYLNKEFN